MDQLAVDIELNPLHRADGSAKYSYNGVSIVGGVNGPVEIQRRDEIPEEAAIDVVIRPATGVGGAYHRFSMSFYGSCRLIGDAGVRERYLESIVESILRHIVLVAAHPRKLIQVTLQIVTMAEDDSMISILPQAASVRSWFPSST